MPAGYSKTPLIQKLGIKAGHRARFINAPPHYAQLLGSLPNGITIAKSARGPLDFIHFFAAKGATLRKEFPRLKKALAFDGILWVSWPKGGSSIPTDLKEADVRDAGLAAGLVDVKICAVDDDWSGLKFVYRLKNRR
ncbi:MAG: DUF3052 domain-containing protein [Phycisphaerales bacterium]|nr:DUF3052 domain-containing protein [Phycisphaerales bacterium]MCI0629808.1 DUF3052 domain-containing protein [Phycisphaerales bacterium]MCI0674690.1 DUF3052 domain-containing protein [Phycisphaerales bacterium]